MEEIMHGRIFAVTSLFYVSLRIETHSVRFHSPIRYLPKISLFGPTKIFVDLVKPDSLDRVVVSDGVA